MNHDFETLTGYAPFPWQAALYEHFVEGKIPQAAMLPTGLGKTSVIAVWLLALTERPDRIPRRLVYVVNRRTVVDQTTNEVERLRKHIAEKPELEKLRASLSKLCATASSNGEPPLAISTLRGQFADNREWCADPSRPAVICGTVDMIGSRLLFSGYRIGFKSRPLHAGFLGQDALLVHDEAHLEPAFHKLIETIAAEQKRCHRRNPDADDRPLRVMQMTATTRGNAQLISCHEQDDPFLLTNEDLQHDLVQQRVHARKNLRLHSVEDEKNVPGRVAAIAAAYKDDDAAILIFARTLDAVSAIESELKETKRPIMPLTGTMRGLERDSLANNNPVFMRFLPESSRNPDIQPAKGTVYLICTSAGEVGVDISAEHLVCDLSTFESMGQRFGRVNRYGNHDETRIDVVHPKKFDDKDKLSSAREATLSHLRSLDGDASPVALSKLMNTLTPEQIDAAFTPEPITPPTTEILFDAWAMTSIRGSMPGRPPVEPYLHGIAEWEPPRTSVAWREEVEVINDDLIARYGADEPDKLLDDWPLKPHELLNDTTERVCKALTEMAKRTNDNFPVWIVSDRGDVVRDGVQTVLASEKKRVINRLAGCTVLLPPSVGGLAQGMLTGKSGDANDVSDQWMDENNQPRRHRLFSDDPRPENGPTGMALIRTIDMNPSTDESVPPYSEVEGMQEVGEQVESSRRSPGTRFWHWYVRPTASEDATTASIRPVTWIDHTNDVVQRAKALARALALPDDLQQAITLAAELHDLGKRRELWQRSIGNPNPTDWYAKPGKPESGPRWRPRFISPYRHEFGSLLDTLDSDKEHLARLNALSEEMQDVILHLIAAHHGYARPHFRPETTVDPNHQQSRADEIAVEVMRRYTRLQRRYGRWGLAYLESILRSADWAASAQPSVHLAPAEAAS